MLRALLAGVLVALPAAVVGTFVVIRGLTFIGDALAHGVIPGVAAALLLGAPGIVGAAVGAAAMVGGVELIGRRTRLSGDAAIGLMFVAMLALGVVIISRSDEFAGDVTAILFGDILGISAGDLAAQAVVAAAVVVVGLVLSRPFLLLAFDPATARAAGVPVRAVHLALLVLVAATVVASFQAVGSLLVFGMLVAPPATAALWARRVTGMVAISAAIGVVSVWSGLLISYHQDTAAGATIVLIQAAVFALALTVHGLRRRPTAAAA